MNIVKWDPFRSLLDVPRLGASLEIAERDRNWAPVVDVYEKGDDVVIRAELPGVAREDMQISVENGVLTLSGERKTDEEFRAVNPERAYRRERFFGEFSRSFTLPDSVDTERIAASFKNGVLEIRVPKAERAKARKIEVDAA